MRYKDTDLDVIRIIKHYFSPVKSTNNGEWLHLNCPFTEKHNTPDRKKRWYVNIFSGWGHCFKCETEMFIDKFCEHFNLIQYKRQFRPQPVVIKETPKELSNLDVFGFEPLWIPTTNPVAKKSLEYLNGRGVTKKQIFDYSLHYACLGKYAWRVIIPLFLNNKCISFIARTVVEDKKKILTPSGYEAQSSTETLFNYDEAKDYDKVIIVEGVFDAIHVGDNAVSLNGKSISETQFNLLLQTKAEELVVVLDPDAVKSCIKVAEKLNKFKNTKVCLLEGDQDPAEWNKEALLTFIDEQSMEPWRAAVSARIR